MSSCTKSWCAIDRHPACSNWHKPLSLWWLAATAAGGGFPGMHLGSVSRAVVNSGQAPVIVARIPQDPAVPA